MLRELNNITLPIGPSALRTKCRTARFQANAAPWRLAHRDSDLTKEAEDVPGGHTPPTLSPSTAGPLGVTSSCTMKLTL
jgi:hypothetical protein